MSAGLPHSHQPSRPLLAAAALVAAAALLAGACGGGGGGGGGGITPPPPPTTLNFMGTARATGPTSCTGDSHNFQAADGAISVTLVSTTNHVGMAVQVCAGGIDDNNCSINLTPIAEGQTINGARRGAAGQNLKFNTANCGGNGPVPADPVQYTARITFVQP
jgi:hypothetical protein